MTKEEAEKFVEQRTETDYHSGSSVEHHYIDVYEVYKLLDLIFDETIKDSFNNNSNCIINIG